MMKKMFLAQNKAKPPRKLSRKKYNTVGNSRKVATGHSTRTTVRKKQVRKGTRGIYKISNNFS